MPLYVNCTTNDVGAEVLIRLLLVDSTGEPYPSCDNQDLSWGDLVRLLIGEDENGDPALRVYVP